VPEAAEEVPTGDRFMSENVRKKEKGKHKKILFAGLIVVLYAVIVLYAIRLYLTDGTKDSAKVEAGLAYLKNLENGDLNEVSEEIRAIQMEKRREKLETDENAVWSAFNNAAILGDSRAVGFYTWEFLPESRVLAQGGGMITDVPEYLDQLEALDPAEVFLCFGLNDIGIGEWPVAEDYAVTYAENVELIKEALPNVEIYVNSTLPAVGVGLSADPDYPRIDEYNEAIKAMCQEKGYHYVDNTTIAKENEDLYQEDGLHVRYEFYLIWATNMIAEVMSE
jgi:lysophospholipase L1-like esterase